MAGVELCVKNVYKKGEIKLADDNKTILDHVHVCNTCNGRFRYETSVKDALLSTGQDVRVVLAQLETIGKSMPGIL